MLAISHALAVKHNVKTKPERIEGWLGIFTRRWLVRIHWGEDQARYTKSGTSVFGMWVNAERLSLPMDGANSKTLTMQDHVDYRYVLSTYGCALLLEQALFLLLNTATAVLRTTSLVQLLLEHRITRWLG